MAEPRPRGGGHGDVSWIRTRLLSAPGWTAALAALVVMTAFLAAALPRAVDRYENDALRDTLRQAPVAARSVTMSQKVSRLSTPYNAEALLTPDAFGKREAAFQQVIRPPLALDGGQMVYGVRSGDEIPAKDPGLPRLGGHPQLDPQMTLVIQPNVERNAQVVSGRLPRPGAKDSGAVEAVITDRTANRMGLRTGSAVHLMDVVGSKLTIRIAGIVTPRSPQSAYWNAEPDLRAPGRIVKPSVYPEVIAYWHFTALIAPSATSALLRLNGGAVAYWHHPAAIDMLTARDVPAVQAQISALNAGPGSAKLQALAQQRALTVEEDGLGASLAPFLRERAAVQPLILVAAVGVGTVAVLVLLMAAGLQVSRRRAELKLLRARGIALPGLCARLLGESVVVSLPSAALGLALALFAVPTERWGAAALAAAVVAVLSSVGLPLRGVAAARRLQREQREDLVAARPSRRRTVAELAVAVVVAGAVVALRRRGTDGGADVLMAAAPVLVAVVAALVLLRVYPMPVRLMGRPATRLKGAVLQIGIASAGRAPSAAALPLVTVLIALAVASFGGSVLAGVANGRDHAAVVKVGADARVQSYAALPKGLDSRVRHLAGVDDMLGVRVETGQTVMATGTRYDIAVVDPELYARLSEYTRVGKPFRAAALADPGRGPAPVIASPRIARELGHRTAIKTSVTAGIEVQVAGTVDATPAVAGREFVIISEASVRRAHPRAAAAATRPTTLFGTGAETDGMALREAVRDSAPEARVLLRSEERDAYGSTTALQAGARNVYLAAVAAAAVFSALGLLLSLLHNAPQRRTLLARLRTMGMTGRQRQSLAVLEMLPQIALGAIGGVLVGLATVRLLRPGIDLKALAFATTSPATDVSAAVLRTDLGSLLLPSVALVSLACAVLVVQAWATGRRGEGTELRIGDRS
ncbi:FtsX-like permease family protein [Actinacidiphila glaucinigra]|uniref:FtsX-like permease family protein n=1 Tax=Actinacidiphila glaucinigra TaxID=235986 RepID=UPI0035DFF7A0